MFRVEVHRRIEQMTLLFYRVGIWHLEDEDQVAERRLKLLYSIYYFLLPVSFITGALASDNKEEFILSVESALVTSVLLVKLWYLIWRKTEFLEMLNRICDYGVEDSETFTLINNKLKNLMKFVAVFLSVAYLCGICTTLVAPYLGSERSLFINIGFPLDHKNDEFAYWLAVTFIFTQMIVSSITWLFTESIWYLMSNGGLRNLVLRQQIKNMGKIGSFGAAATERKISDSERDNLYLRDLRECVHSHNYLKELTNQLEMFTSEVFVLQLATSGLCICCSIYSLAFSRGDHLIELLIYLLVLCYNIFDIFMIMYFGNEIKLASDRLSYCLFESDWVDRPGSIKENFLIFGEFLMKPHQLVILKIYPLSLDTFARIKNSAYSMFNILKNFK